MAAPEDLPFDATAFEAFVEERMRWAQLTIPMKVISEEVPALTEELEEFEPVSTAALVSGLLTVPECQSATLRIELLVTLVLMKARGCKRANNEDLARWFSAIGESDAAAGEDPAEDVMVTLVTTPDAHARAIEGTWESAGFYTQRVLDVLQGMPDNGLYAAAKSEVRALLALSEAMCERAELVRYQTGSDDVQETLNAGSIPSEQVLRHRVSLSLSDLRARGIELSHLQAFVLSPDRFSLLADQEPGTSELDRRPLIYSDQGLVVALPTAITIAVRERVIELVQATRQEENFDIHYAAALGRVISDTQLLHWKSGCDPHWKSVRGGQIAGVIAPFDRGHFIVLHFVLPSVESHEMASFKRISEAPRELLSALDYAIASTTRQVQDAPDFRAGMHVIVMCGWGQGLSFSVSLPDDARWRRESVSVADLIRLSHVTSMSVQRFWRLEAAQEALEQAGVTLVNVNGVLNLFAWMEANEGHLVPHADLEGERISPKRRLMLHPPLNMLRDLRAKTDQASDRHVAIDPRGESHLLERVERSPFFNNPASDRFYACGDCVSEGSLVAACEGAITLWLRVEAAGLESRDLLYRLWDTLGKWGGQIVEFFERASSISGSFEISLILKDVQVDVDQFDATVPSDARVLLRSEVVGENAADIHAERGFLLTFRDPRNIAERALVESLARAVLKLAGHDDDESLVQRLSSTLLPNQTARHFHMMHAEDFTDYVRDLLPDRVLDIDEIDSATLRLGLGWSVHEGGNDIVGKKECSKLLNTLVDARVERITERLGGIDRAALIDRLLMNHQAAHAKEMHWKRTSAGVLGIHGDSEALRSTVVGQLAIAAGAKTTSRVLVEMAVCSSPLEGGHIPDDLETQQLLAEVALLIHLGGLSDGIHYGALEPQLRVSPLGDILLADKFGREVVEPMLSGAVGTNYVRSAEEYKRYYSRADPVDSTEHLLEKEFVDAWGSEMGFGIDEGRRIVDLLEHIAITRRRPVLDVRHSELVGILAAEVSQSAAEAFIAGFRLQPRARWNIVPEGFKMREILPWRYGRRLSLVTRPLLQLDDRGDQTYRFAPQLLRSGFFYVLRGAYDGTLDQEFFQTPGMRDLWWGKANEGHTFNASVGARLRSAGFKALEGLELSAILRRKMERDYGDVDVLAWRSGYDEVFVIECKDLSMRRNYSEIAALLSDYRGGIKNGKPDKLKRHLDRVNRLGEDIAALGEFVGFGSPKIASCMVVGGPVPMQLASIPSLAHTFVGSTDEFLARFAH